MQPMRWTQTFLPTLKEAPKEAETPSHQLLLRAGLIRKLAGGIYTFLPLGLRALRKVEQIVREEMNRAGAIEVLMPALSPKQLWQRGPRWEAAQKVMFAATPADPDTRLAAGSEMVLGPTHEEVITSLVADHIRSYRDLPKNFYQIQTKFRNELRPRFGLMRAREFMMKDAYSFDVDEAAALQSYEAMRTAYQRIFQRCGFPPEKLRCVLADTGVMGGSRSQEFLVPAPVGECEMARCEACGYGANLEKAVSRVEALPTPSDPLARPIAGPTPAKFPTPRVQSIEDLTRPPYHVPAHRQIKTLVYIVEDQPHLILLRGDHLLNEVKLAATLGTPTFRAAADAEIVAALGARAGSLGAVGVTDLPILADEALRGATNMVTGANQDGVHLRGVDLARDIRVRQWADLRLVAAGDGCPQCGRPISVQPAIELGHIFLLGTKYAEKLGANYLDEKGRQRPCVMGCYGIGVSRTLQAVVEVFHDNKGIRWPMSVAPFQVLLCALDTKGEPMNVAVQLHEALQNNGVEVLLDDRDERPGVKFHDADLIGIPLRVTIGGKSLAQGGVELRDRASGETKLLAAADAVKEIVPRTKA